MIMKILQTIGSLVQTGIEEPYDERKKNIITTVNFISLSNSLLAFVGASVVYFFVTPQKLIIFPAIIETICFLSLVYLNHLKKHNTATHIFFLLQNMAVLYYGLILDRSAGVQQMGIFLVGLSFLLFQPVALRISAILISLFTVVVLEINYNDNIIRLLPANPDTITLTKWIVYPIVMILNSMVLILYENNYIKLIKRLRAVSNAKSIFVREVSHEIRTPLNAVFSISQLLKMDMEQKEELLSIKPVIIHLHAACYNAQGIINNVLEMSKIEAGKQDDLDMRSVHVQSLLTDITDVCQYLAYTRSVKLVSSIAENMPELIITDKVKLTQIVNNLLANAIKFTVPGSTVSLWAGREQDKWILSVQDQGKGIPADKIGAIFDPFVTEKADFTQGTGLGLHITKRLVELLQGSITVNSLPGKGTRFTVQLPLLIGEESNTATPKPAMQLNGHGNKKVLIIEDDRMSQVYLAQFLFRLDLQVLLADNGVEGLEKIGLERPDIIILDMQMPDMDGMEVLTALQRDPALRNIPVIAVSGDVFKEVRDAALQAGVSDYVVKPVDFKLLYFALRKHLKHLPLEDTYTKPFSHN